MKLLSIIETVVWFLLPDVAFGKGSPYRGITQIRFANAWCESGGNIHAIGWHGLYRGKWQFDRSTWRSFAPRGWRYADPAWAPEWVQDRAALAVTYDAWPNC